MRRILFVGVLALASNAPAFAADLPPAAPAPRAAYVPAAPAFSWTGFYVGTNGGYGFGQSKWNTPLGSVGGFATNGPLAGATAGGNYQWGQFVLGIEGDADWQNLRGSQTSAPCSTVGVGSCATVSNWISTIRGRAGFAMDRTLLYITAGGAFANVKPSTGALPFSGGTEPGWTAGAGVEFAMTDNWTAKLEYLYADFQRNTCNVGSCGILGAASVQLTENMLRVGVNYKFGY